MSERITQAVKSKYGSVATSGLSSDLDGVKAIAEAFGYTPEELASIPAEANMGLSCGNPTAFASLREGEMIVDLGSGGGLDVLLAARKVGPRGKAIGIDMTPEMIDLARANALKSGLVNIEYHLATIDKLPLADATVDCVISNCVINLAPDKPAVFREIARILKPGGRLAISDIALKRELPAEIGDDLMAHVGCIAGAILIEDYRRMLTDAGFAHVEIIDSGKDPKSARTRAAARADGCCPLGGSCLRASGSQRSGYSGTDRLMASGISALVPRPCSIASARSRTTTSDSGPNSSIKRAAEFQSPATTLSRMASLGRYRIAPVLSARSPATARWPPAAPSSMSK